MQVDVERLPQSRARLTVTIPVDDVTRAMDVAFKKLVRRYEIPGFRRGKAPRSVFERFVGRQAILQEAAEQLVEGRYPEAVEQAALDPVERPRISLEKVEDGEPLIFVAETAVKPVVDLGDYQSLLAEPLVVTEITDDLMDQELQKTAESEAQWVPASEEEPVEAGSRVVVDLRGREEGQDEPFVESTDYAVEVGRGTLLEGLETQFIGLKVNQSATLHVIYPEDYPDSNLAGKSADFEVTVKEHKRREVPSIDDELAKTKGLNDLQELRETVSNSLRERLEQEAREARLRAILGKLKERVSVDVPEPLVDRAVSRQVQDFEYTLSRLGATLEQYLQSRGITLEALTEDMRPGARDRVVDQLLLEAIAKAETITVSDDEVIDAIRPVADSYQRPLNSLVESLKVTGDFEAVRGNLLVDKAADFVREPRTA